VGLTYVKILSRYLPGETEENPKPSTRILGASAEIQSCYLPNASLRCCHVTCSVRESDDDGIRDVNMSGPRAHGVVT
jgi:hypothetical protein